MLYLRNFQIFENINRKAIAFDKIGGNHALSAYSTKNIIRVFLHAEFISAMKTVQNPMVFVKKMQKNIKIISFGNFC